MALSAALGALGSGSGQKMTRPWPCRSQRLDARMFSHVVWRNKVKGFTRVVVGGEWLGVWVSGVRRSSCGRAVVYAPLL